VDVADRHFDLVGIQLFMEMIFNFSVAVAVIIGLVEVVKRIGLPSKFAPLVSVILGVGFSFIFPGETIGLTILFGVVTGLTACGLYSGTKATIQEKV
jgi:hypothetical protein